VTCEAWQVVIVPFPFTDRGTTKKRPALVLSHKRFNRHGHTILAMVTSAAHAPWPGDVRLTNLKEAGLVQPCTSGSRSSRSTTASSSGSPVDWPARTARACRASWPAHVAMSV
jgi:mRNA-degrading endonuclease toxin of MazEF toxin-antitoxin module